MAIGPVRLPSPSPGTESVGSADTLGAGEDEPPDTAIVSTADDGSVMTGPPSTVLPLSGMAIVGSAPPGGTPGSFGIATFGICSTRNHA